MVVVQECRNNSLGSYFHTWPVAVVSKCGYQTAGFRWVLDGRSSGVKIEIVI